MNSGLMMLRRLSQIRSYCTIERNSICLRVGNIPWTVSKRELKQYFARFGPVSKVEVVFDEKTGLSLCNGYIKFEMDKSYMKALETKVHLLEGKVLRVTRSEDPYKNTKQFIAKDEDEKIQLN